MKTKVYEEYVVNNNTDWWINQLGVKQAWNKTKGSNVKIALMDTGVDLTHPMIEGKVKSAINMFERSGDVTDEYGHGTHIASIVSKIAPKSEIHVSKILNKEGLGAMKHVYDGITFAINNEVDLLSISLGQEHEPYYMLHEKIKEAHKEGITIVCAAGNSGYRVEYPASYPEVLAVGGVDRYLNRLPFSCEGPTLNFMGPAEEIFGAWPGGKYATMTGTSQAAPFVVGMLALIISNEKLKGNNLTPDELKTVVINSTGRQFDHYYGNGIIDLKNII